MASPADHFTRLQKVAIFLIALGAEKTREILADVDLETIESLNTAIARLGPVKPEEKAAVMLEFADFFYAHKPISGRPRKKKAPTSSPAPSTAQAKQPTEAPADESALRNTLQTLRRRLDPSQIDWGRAGYDFGEGFKGPPRDRS